MRLGKNLLSQGRPTDAEPIFREYLAIWEGERPDHDLTPEAISTLNLDTISDLAVAYEAIGKFEPAERLLRSLLERARRLDGPKTPAVAGVLAMLGQNLLRQGRYADAEPMLRECLTIREEKLPDSWQRFNAMSLLGGALLGQQKYAEAEPLLLQGYDGMKQREATIPPPGKVRLPEALERLVQLYDALGRKDKADEWRTKFQAARVKKEK
jgi:tetratricopeptide (TPR) repeat protein